MLPNVFVLIAASAAVGVITHRTYWSRHEFDAQLPRILIATKVTAIALFCIFSRFASRRASIYYTSLTLASYFLALFLRIAVYRTYYHPLRKLPGPFWARLTAWWKVKHIATNGPHYALTSRLHSRYGDVVRTGPNNVSINCVEALQAIYGSQSPCTKPPSYLIGGLVSVQSERDPHRHRLRRTVWDKALGTNASNAFYPRLKELTELMVARLEDHNGAEVCVNDWMHFITFDTMAQFCFSKDWNQLKSGKVHEGIKYASEYLKFAVFGTQVPWLAISLMKIPFMPEPQSAMLEFSAKALDDRARTEPLVPDAMTYILKEKDPEAQQFLSRHDLESDVFMIMLAGADTSFSVLVNLCFRLALNQQYQTDLREEVASAFSTDEQGRSIVDWPTLSASTFLTALINETLRLHPPVPSGMPRLTPEGGISILLDSSNTSHDDVLQIPGQVVVSVPTHLIHRSDKYWTQPNDFIPERWTTRPDLIQDKRAWCPFSLGNYGCAGKYFALMEIKLVISHLVMAFNLQLVGNVDHEQMNVWLDAQDDHMTLQPSMLKLKFMSRNEFS